MRFCIALWDCGLEAGRKQHGVLARFLKFTKTNKSEFGEISMFSGQGSGVVSEFFEGTRGPNIAVDILFEIVPVRVLAS